MDCQGSKDLDFYSKSHSRKTKVVLPTAIANSVIFSTRRKLRRKKSFPRPPPPPLQFHGSLRFLPFFSGFLLRLCRPNRRDLSYKPADSSLVWKRQNSSVGPKSASRASVSCSDEFGCPSTGSFLIAMSNLCQKSSQHISSWLARGRVRIFTSPSSILTDLFHVQQTNV